MTSASSLQSLQSHYMPSISRYSNLLSQISRTASENSAWNAQQAALNRDWQRESNRLAMDFSAGEAAKNRSWQQYMSDTAHQREVRDLKAAGLNPVLSAMGGQGAAVTSGATASGYTSSGGQASADTSANQAFVSLLGSMLQAQSTIANSATSALANLGAADKYAAASRYAADMGLAGVTYSADVHAAAQRYTSDNALLSSEIMSTAQKWAAQYAADSSKAASVLAASLSYSASKYNIDKRTLTDKELAEFNADVNKELKKMDIGAKFTLQQNQAFVDAYLARYHGGIFGSGLSLGTLTDTTIDAILGDVGANARSVFGSKLADSPLSSWSW